MATVGERMGGGSEEAWVVAEDGGDETSLTLRLYRVDHAVKASYGAAKIFLWTALATMPFVAAYHIEIGPELRVEVDLGSSLWLGLFAGAFVASCNGLRLMRTRRRLSERLDQTVRGVVPVV